MPNWCIIMVIKDKQIFKDLIQNMDKIHTTPLGVLRIKKNLCLDNDDVIEWCIESIKNLKSIITKQGKNYYININDCK